MQSRVTILYILYCREFGSFIRRVVFFTRFCFYICCAINLFCQECPGFPFPSLPTRKLDKITGGPARSLPRITVRIGQSRVLPAWKKRLVKPAHSSLSAPFQ